MKVPHFENCQVILEPKGSIIEASEEFCDWVGQSLAKMSGQSFRNLMISMEQEWEDLIPKLEQKTRKVLSSIRYGRPKLARHTYHLPKLPLTQNFYSLNYNGTCSA